jgi:pyruvate/2-oxoglutarate dehydrogenase complex dihydrolipoamide acyltransferase (E2) component
VIAQGAVKVDQNVKEVQHRDGGTVQVIGVRQGDSVSEGQVLFRLDDVQIRTELSIIRSSSPSFSAGVPGSSPSVTGSTQCSIRRE